MTARVASTRDATSEDWERAWAGSPVATFFHSPQWCALWEAATGGKVKAVPLHVRLEDGAEAVVVLARRRSRLLRREHFMSSPAGTYGGWISASPLNAAQAGALAELMTTRFHRLTWRLNPLDHDAVTAVGPEAQADETHMLDLQEGFESLLRRWTKGHRSAARKARREGVIIRPAHGRKEWREYYAVYMDSVRRWGARATMVHPWSLFETMSQVDSDAIQLWVATQDSQIIAGALTLRSWHHLSYWHGAALESFFPLRPVHWLLHEIIRDACDAGTRWFDMNPSGGLDGVRAFKRGFGAEAVPAPLVTRPRRRP